MAKKNTPTQATKKTTKKNTFNEDDFDFIVDDPLSPEDQQSSADVKTSESSSTNTEEKSSDKPELNIAKKPDMPQNLKLALKEGGLEVSWDIKEMLDLKFEVSVNGKLEMETSEKTIFISNPIRGKKITVEVLSKNQRGEKSKPVSSHIIVPVENNDEEETNGYSLNQLKELINKMKTEEKFNERTSTIHLPLSYLNIIGKVGELIGKNKTETITAMVHHMSMLMKDDFLKQIKEEQKRTNNLLG